MTDVSALAHDDSGDEVVIADPYTYPVGLLSDIKRHRVAYGIRGFLFRQIKARNWRAVRNYFNGYLAEHDGHPHNAGRGWTRRAAQRRVNNICARAALEVGRQ